MDTTYKIVEKNMKRKLKLEIGCGNNFREMEGYECFGVDLIEPKINFKSDNYCYAKLEER
mgnify:CR=1 FL=1